MPKFAFSVACDNHPSAVTRVLDVFTLYDQLPERLHAQAERDFYVMDVECRGLDEAGAERIRKKLLGLVAVSDVLMSVNAA